MTVSHLTDCLFCRIVQQQAPAILLYQDEHVTAFRDKHPLRRVHILLVPNKHIASVSDLSPEDEVLMGRLFGLARDLAVQEGIVQDGYRIAAKTGRGGGQTVFHLHLHLTGGERVHHILG